MPPDQPPPVDTPDPEPFVDTYKLRLVGNGSVMLYPGQQVTLQVHYAKNGKPFGGQPIYFSFNGAFYDSGLTAYQVVTDSAGFAETVLTAGKLTTTYLVEAQSDKDGPVAWSVQVVPQPAPPPPSVPVLTGTFDVTSNFDVQTNFTGSDLANALNTIYEMTDDPADPGKYVVDMVLDEVDNQAVLVVATLLKPALYAEVNKMFYNAAPTLVAGLKQLGQDISAIARKFELGSAMISATSQPGDKPMTVDHMLKTIAWTLQGQRVEHTFNGLGLQAPVVKGVQLVRTTAGDLSVSEHTFKLNYGVFLLAGLESLIIPKLKPGATSLEGLFKSWVNCQSVGQSMNNTVGLGGVPLWQAACDAGLKALAFYLEDTIAKIDNNDSSLTISGTGKLWDANYDGTFDTMNYGIWTGNLKLDQCEAPLSGNTNTFSGTRSTTTP
jgi:hypothetical protein